LGAEPLLIINNVVNTRRTQQTHIIGVTTPTSRNKIQVNLVGKTDATIETVVEHGFRTRNRNGGKGVGFTPAFGI
jgi:hypothetical protein